MNLHEKLSLIQQEFKAKKSRYNSFGKYNFRSAEDILEGLKPFNKKYGVYFTVSEEPADTFAGDAKHPPMIVSKAAIHDGETKIEASAVVGIDLNQKGMQTPQQFGSASSYGKKYALGNLLLIDDTADADATNNHGRGSTIPGPGKQSTKVKPRIDESNIDKAFTFLKNGGKIETLQQTYLMDDSILQKLKNG